MTRAGSGAHDSRIRPVPVPESPGSIDPVGKTGSTGARYSREMTFSGKRESAATLHDAAGNGRDERVLLPIVQFGKTLTSQRVMR
jgi:hypothetical protein